MNSIKSSEYNSADNYDYPEFIAIKNDEQRTPDEGFDNLEEAKVRADKIGGFVYQMINGEGVEIYSANESTTETTESEKATEIKEEFSENAYLQLINETTPVPMEFHGRYYNSAEEWKEHDPIAFRESYMAWIDGNEKDGVDTGDDGYESNTKGMPKGIPTEDIEALHDVGNLYAEWNKDFDGSRQDFIDYAEAKGFNPKVAGSTYETQHPENEEWQYGGELKANESFYDQALWIAKAKLEDGGLDIISALPDIIRNTRTSTGRDIDEDELSRAIEDAIDTYRNMLKTGMSMWGDRSTKASESYWGNQGQYQDLYSKYHSEIPDEGSVNDSLLEQLRIVSNVYYEVGNNGGGNMISGMGSAGEHGKINATIPETTWLVNRTEQTENSGGLEYEEEQELIRASLQELDGVVDNLLQQIKNDRADKDEQSNYWGESGQVEPDENWNVGRWTSGKGLNEDMYADDDVKLDTEAEIDNYIKEGTDPAPYEEEDMPESIKSELKDEGKERSKSDIQAMKDLGAGDFAGDIPDDMSVDQWLGGDDNEDKDEAEEIIGAMGMADDLMDTYGSSPNADPTTTPLEDHSGTDDSSDTQTDTVDAQQETSDISGDTVEESFGDCGCKDTNKARTTWESAKEGDKQYWLRNMGEDEGYSYYHFEHLPKRVGESLVDKFKIEESEDRGWSKIPALERTNLLRKLGFPPRDAELVANLEYPQLSESLKKDVNDAVIVKKRAEESQREKPDEQLAFENDLYSNMYDGFLKRRGERVDSKKNDKF